MVRETLIKAAGVLLRFVNFRLYYRICSLLVRKLTGERVVSVSNFQIKFERNDPYWSQLMSKQFRYESELENWLRRECSPDVYFVDCGANIGYWTLFVSKVLGVSNFVAVEPNPRIFRLLVENFRLNNLPQSALEGAIGDTSYGNSTAKLYFDINPGKHVGASIIQGNKSSSNMYEVPLIQLSDLFEPALRNNQSILLKLDVEGAEILCIQQIPNSLRSRIRIIYEDHGSDLECSTTNWLLATKAYKVFFLQQSSSLEITAIETLKDLKKRINKGYNLVAVPN